METTMDELHVLPDYDPTRPLSRDRAKIACTQALGRPNKLSVPVREVPFDDVCDPSTCGSVGVEVDDGSARAQEVAEFYRPVVDDKGPGVAGTVEDYSGRPETGGQEAPIPRPHLNEILTAVYLPQQENSMTIEEAERWHSAHKDRCTNHFKVVKISEKLDWTYSQIVRMLKDGGQWVDCGPTPYGWDYPSGLTRLQLRRRQAFQEHCDMLEEYDKDTYPEERAIVQQWINQRRSTRSGYAASEVALSLKLAPCLTACMLEELAMFGNIKKSGRGKYSHVMSRVK